MSKFLVIVILVFLSVSAFANSNSPLGIEMVAISKGKTRHIKFNRVTGETCWAKNTVWSKIEESSPIPESEYEFLVVSTGLNWRTIRLNKLTGETWKNSEGKWIKFTTK